MPTKNITLSMPEDLLRRARVLAAERDTSVSGLVAELLQQLVGTTEDYDTMWASEEQVMVDGVFEVGPLTWSRDELHDR